MRDFEYWIDLAILVGLVGLGVAVTAAVFNHVIILWIGIGILSLSIPFAAVAGRYRDE